MDTVIYQQDAATLHCSHASLEQLIVTSLETGSSAIVQSTLSLHILPPYTFCIIFCGDT